MARSPRTQSTRAQSAAGATPRRRRRPRTELPARPRPHRAHATAFRRLVYKTQVFLNHEGDLFRTRLTHSLEVAQLARSIARALRLNEDLVEAIALAHDLGHTPFGHAGQDALNDCMRDARRLRAQPAEPARRRRPRGALPAFDGLNLTFETREGILKHCSRANAQRLEAAEPDGVGAALPRPHASPSLEAQLCNLADEIAYNAHDIDDGVRSGLITLEQLDDVPLFVACAREALADHPALAGPAGCCYETIRRMLSAQVYDVIDATARRAGGSRRRPTPTPCAALPPLVRFSADDASRADGAQALPVPQPVPPSAGDADDRAGASDVVRDLFARLPRRPAARCRPSFATRADRARAVADYIAGMTDRFALREHQRLTGRRVLP